MIFLLVVLLLIPRASSAGCHICGRAGNTALQYPFGYVSSAKMNCAALAVKIYQQNLTVAQCKRIQKKYRKCCDGTPLDPKPPSKPPSSALVPYEGPHPKCNLCRDGSYPKDAYHVINLLYVGQSTCLEYYKAGLRGKIPKYLCSALVYFAEKPCGCEINKN